MALSIIGVDANGRVTPYGTNVIIPNGSAGIGDIVVCKSGADPHTPSDLRIIGRLSGGSNTSFSIGGATYYRYGVIYGFVAGMAMIVADKADESLYWASSEHPFLSGLPVYGHGAVLMRNGNKAVYYAQMNTARNVYYITKSGTAQPSDGLLTSAYQSTPLTSSTFDASANAETKKRFGSWNEYIRQTLRVNGDPGSPFGAVTSGVNVHEFGRWMTKTVHAMSSTLFPAINKCATYSVANTGDVAGNWWLPSMFEMGELMIDDHLTLANNGLINDIAVASNRWSCVLLSATTAWIYYNYGMSTCYGVSGDRLAVRPVTLLRLV